MAVNLNEIDEPDANSLGSSGGIPPLLVDRFDAARLLACSPRTVDSLIAKGEIPSVKFGRAVRVAVIDLNDWIARNRTTKSPAA